MSEAIKQAVTRFARVFIVAGLTAVGLDAPEIVQIGTAGDPIAGPLVLSVVVAGIDAVLKWIGGPSAKAPVTVGRSSPSGSVDAPNFFSV